LSPEPLGVDRLYYFDGSGVKRHAALLNSYEVAWSNLSPDPRKSEYGRNLNNSHAYFKRNPQADLGSSMDTGLSPEDEVLGQGFH